MQGGIIANAPANTNVQTAAINFAASGDNTVIAGVATQTIRIHKISFTVHAASNIILKSGTTALSGAMEFNALGGLVLDLDTFPIITGSGSAFVMNNSNAVQVSGIVLYTQG